MNLHHFRISLIIKVGIGSLLSALCLAAIVAVIVASSQQVKRLITDTIAGEVPKIVQNTTMGRELNQVFSDVSLLFSTFLDNAPLVQQERTRLIPILDAYEKRLHSDGHAELQTALQEFRQTLNALFGQCVIINTLSQEIHVTETALDAQFTNLEEVIAEKLITIAMEGKTGEGLAIEQLSTMLPQYRLSLSQIHIHFYETKQTHLKFTGHQEQTHIETVSGMFTELITRLNVVATIGPDFSGVGMQLIDQVNQYQQQILTFHQHAEELQQRYAVMQRAREQIITAMGEIDQASVAATGHITSHVAEVIRSSYWVIMPLSGFAVILMTFSVYYVMTIIRPIKYLAAIAEQLANGDIACKVPEVSSHDEIGVLSGAFKQLIAYLQEMASAATEIAQGDLSRQVRPRSARDVLGHAFLNMSAYLNEMATEATALAEGDLQRNVHPKTEHDVLGNAFQQIKTLRQLISEIIAGALELHSASEQLHQISTEMASSAEQASRQTQFVSSNSRQISENVEAVAIAAQEMSTNIKEISYNTSQAAQIAQEAVELAKTANHTIADLEAHSQEIGEIITIITAVSQQTNLLALNATIEAARAGDYGRGFAVVAHEIKELSRETASSAEDIIRKLEAIRSGSRDATKAITEVSEIIMKIRNLSVSMASGIEEQSATTNEIAIRMNETAGGSQEITRVITEVASVTQNTSEGIANVYDAARNLAALARRLQELVGRFKI